MIVAWRGKRGTPLQAICFAPTQQVVAIPIGFCYNFWRISDYDPNRVRIRPFCTRLLEGKILRVGVYESPVVLPCSHQPHIRIAGLFAANCLSAFARAAVQ